MEIMLLCWPMLILLPRTCCPIAIAIELPAAGRDDVDVLIGPPLLRKVSMTIICLLAVWWAFKFCTCIRCLRVVEFGADLSTP